MQKGDCRVSYPLDKTTHLLIKDERKSRLALFLWQGCTNVAEKEAMELVIAHFHLPVSLNHSIVHCIKSPFRRSGTCSFDRIYSGKKRERNRGKGGWCIIYSWRTWTEPTAGVAQSLTFIGLWSKDRHLWIFAAALFAAGEHCQAGPACMHLISPLLPSAWPPLTFPCDPEG
jgi:hypothetical protein